MKGKMKLAMEIEESSSDVIEYGLISHPMTCSLDKLRREMCSSLGQLPDASRWRAFEEKAGDMKRSMRIQNKASTASVQVNEAGEPPSDLCRERHLRSMSCAH